MSKVVLTREERRAVLELKDLSRRWPKTLKLVSLDRSIGVIKDDVEGCESYIEFIAIPVRTKDDSDVKPASVVAYE